MLNIGDAVSLLFLFHSCSDVAGFAHLTTLMQPREVVKIIDHLHALIDGAFTGDEIFLMEHSVSGCIAASGLVESYPEPARSNATSQLSMTDSSYGSECDLEFSTSLKVKPKKITSPPPSRSATPAQSKEYPLPETPQHFAGVLATAALQLMSSSVRVDIPCSRSRQLQLRIALHSGPCLAGVVGLQTIPGTSRIPHYKLFGPTLRHTHNLCMTGLALQIRVSRQCHELLSGGDGFHFERCPDYTMWHSQKPIESYWLVSKEGLDLKLPSLDGALPLTEYDDTDV